MKATFFISIGFLFIVSNSFAQSSWTRRADFPELRYRAAAFNIGNKGYVGTGLAPTRRMNDFWQYDPLSDTWQQKDSLPASGREGAIGFSINGKGYIGGGVTDTFTPYQDFWEYNPQTGVWTQKADIPINNYSSGTLTAFSINGKGYIHASFNADNFWEYDPSTDTWTKKATFPGGDLHCQVAFAIGLKGYLGTGFGPYSNTQAFWEYDPSDDRWTQRADFSGTPRNGAVGFTIGGKGYIGLGNAGGTFPKDFWAYDTINDSWTRADSCGYVADGAFAFSIGLKGYVGTGVFTTVGEFWEFDPSVISLGNFVANPVQNFLLQQNCPNPFNRATTIEYSLAKATNVTLQLLDCFGRKHFVIDSGFRSSGKHSIRLNMNFLPSGTYFYKISTQSYSATRKLVLLR